MAIVLREDAPDEVFLEKIVTPEENSGSGYHVRGSKTAGSRFITSDGTEVDVAKFKADMIKKYEEQQKAERPRSRTLPIENIEKKPGDLEKSKV
jgi:hypothetical protein